MERAVYRIIDANFNRAREAARVVEEYCRFALDSRLLCERAKRLRQELSAAIGKLDSLRLIASRDTAGDVGISSRVQSQLRRKDLADSFTAGCKRLTEALRVLAEMIQPTDPAVAAKMEDLRYAAYTLEKDIVLFSDAGEKFKRVAFYVIVSSSLPSDVLSLTGKCIAGGADCIQLRAKQIPDNELFVLAREFAGMCREAGVLSIVNDRADIAVAAGADGVHLGQDDLPVEQVRKFASAPLIIGRTTHSIEQLKGTLAELPTYVSLGPVFATPTKPDVEAVGLDYVRSGLEALADTGVAHVAIGGINAANMEEVLKAGARAIAVCSAVTKAADPAAICRELKNKMDTFRS